jgi:hypothetical protein
MYSPWGIFDWESHTVMRECSKLRHTAVDNGLGPLFEPHVSEAVRKVLSGEASPVEFQSIRDRIERWATIREQVETNLEAFESEYTPYSDGLDALEDQLPPHTWKQLAAAHRLRMKSLLRIDEFVASVRLALCAFNDGFRSVRDGAISVKELGEFHARLVDVYRAR